MKVSLIKMALLDVASGASRWRGYEYASNNKVLRHNKLSEYEFEGKISGSDSKTYNVFIDVEHPRKSKCNCPHAKDKRIVCKHIVALYFVVFPEEAIAFIKCVEDYKKEEEQRERDMEINLEKYINNLSKEELREALWGVLYDSPEWVFDRFIEQRID